LWWTCPEEEEEFALPATKAGLNFIYLTAPTTNDERLTRVLRHASGFVYYVSVAGVTGTASAAQTDVEAAVKRIKAQTDLPVAVGFGIKTPEQAADVAKAADASVVGSALVDLLARNIGKSDVVETVLNQVRALADGVRGARQ